MPRGRKKLKSDQLQLGVTIKISPRMAELCKTDKKCRAMVVQDAGNVLVEQLIQGPPYEAKIHRPSD